MKIHAIEAINTRQFPPRNTFTLPPLLLLGVAFVTEFELVPADEEEDDGEPDEVDAEVGGEFVVGLEVEP